MNKYYVRFTNWCNANQGLIAFLALIIAVVTAIPFKNISFNSAIPIIQVVKNIIIYKISIPLSLLILLVFAFFFYIRRQKNKYTTKIITDKILIGTWKNEWTINGNTDSEILKITNDLEYYIGDRHVFNILNFKYNSKKNEITFIKKGVEPGDNRRHLNVLNLINNELLIGFEEEYQIKYSKISD